MALTIARLFAQMPPFSDLADRMQHSPQGFSALRALVTNFTPELKLLGQDTDSYLTRLTALERSTPRAKPFLDVPTGHWAASAVELLRQNGILAGYPNGNVTLAPQDRVLMH